MPYCKNCGKELPEGATFCPNCGAPVAAVAPPQVTQRIEPQRKARPIGISILTILEAIVSLFTLIAGIAMIGLATFLAVGGWGIIPEQELERALREMPWASGFTGVRFMALTTAFLTIMGIVVLAIAVIGFVLAWGLWNGKRWSRTATIVLSALGILLGLFSLPASLVGILIYAVIIYYLTRPHVKAFYYESTSLTAPSLMC